MYHLCLLLLLLTGCAPALVQGTATPASTTLPPAERVAAFALARGISAWPRTDGCAYDRSFSGTTVGLILDINSSTAGTARWDGRCHVPMRHELTGVPPGLAMGRYVVAATANEADEDSGFINRGLQVIGVLGNVPNDRDVIAATLAKICTPVPAAEETDHDCIERGSH